MMSLRPSNLTSDFDLNDRMSDQQDLINQMQQPFARKENESAKSSKNSQKDNKDDNKKRNLRIVNH